MEIENKIAFITGGSGGLGEDEQMDLGAVRDNVSEESGLINYSHCIVVWGKNNTLSII